MADLEQNVTEAIARAIYEAYGYHYAGRPTGANGPYGEWAKAIKAAEAVIALRQSPSAAPVAVKVERSQTKDQIAAIMLQHGSEAQVAEALAYVHGKLTVPAIETPAVPEDALRAACAVASINWTLSADQVLRLYQQVQGLLSAASPTGGASNG